MGIFNSELRRIRKEREGREMCEAATATLRTLAERDVSAMVSYDNFRSLPHDAGCTRAEFYVGSTKVIIEEQG